MQRALALTCLLLTTGFARAATTDTIRLLVTGDLPSTGTIDIATLGTLQSEKVKWTHHDRQYEFTGIRVERLLRNFGFEAGPMGPDVPRVEKRAGWKKVLVATARDGYQAAFSCAEVSRAIGNTEAWVVWAERDRPLDASDGPFRLVIITDREGARSVYQLERLDVVDMRKIITAEDRP